jgi:hypothetical protein
MGLWRSGLEPRHGVRRPCGSLAEDSAGLRCERATVAPANGSCMFMGEQMWVNTGSYSALEPPRR